MEEEQREALAELDRKIHELEQLQIDENGECPLGAYAEVVEMMETYYNQRAEVALQPSKGLDGMIDKDGMHREMNMLTLVIGIPHQLLTHYRQQRERLLNKFEKEDESDGTGTDEN